MANLKKHFVFKVGTSGGTSTSTNLSPSSELLLPGFSKSAFMNEVSSLLDHCGLYISAMNGFCTSGCSLAKCLVKVFHAVPLYRETAATLQANWEEIAATTAAASASVKTETLMQLQDVLTRLESSGAGAGAPGTTSAGTGGGTTGETREDELAESVHAVSSCLMAYIELQAQFSCSVFKALGKLSRQHANGFLKTSRAEDAVRKQFAQIINRFTTTKTPTSPTQPTALPSASSSPLASSAATSHHTGGSVWPAEIHLAPSGVELSSAAAAPDALGGCATQDTQDSGLDDVINLLSIGGASAMTASTSTESMSLASPPPPPLPPSTSHPSASVAGSRAVPKVPPRPDALSQDTFRQLKELEQAAASSSAKPPSSSGTPRSPPSGLGETTAEKSQLEPQSWTPFTQWAPEWSTEDLTNWPSHSTAASDTDWTRWQAKEKTSTWPRPLRDPSAPWLDWLDEDAALDDRLEAGCAGAQGERIAKTCTWPLKVADGSWLDSSEPWKKDDEDGCNPMGVSGDAHAGGAMSPPRVKRGEPGWGATGSDDTEDEPGFQLFTQR